MSPRKLSLIAGTSYWILFFTAIFANFFMLESLTQQPLETVQQQPFMIRLGILAFLITVVFDVVVAWALFELYKNHPLARISTYFRMMHAALMGVALFALLMTLTATTEAAILQQVNSFNTLWLIGLFFFGLHLILLGRVLQKPRLIALLLVLAGLMYMVDTTAHLLMENYEEYASIFLAMVAIPSILGEMSFAVWLLVKGGKTTP